MDSLSLNPPHSIEAEESVIGSILMDPNILEDVLEEVRYSDFYLEKHKIIFKTIEQLFSAALPVDTVTLIDKMRNLGILEKVGGEETLINLAQAVPTTANIMYYANIVKEKALLRNLIQASSEIVESVRTVGDAKEILEFAEKRIFSIAEARATRTYESLSSIVPNVVDQVVELKNKYRRGELGLVTGIPTGFSSLDSITSGFHKSDLIIIAARPSMGKSSFALNLATNMSLKHNVGVAIFSLEMSKEQLANRIICYQSRVDLQKVRTGQISDDEWSMITQVAGDLTDSSLILDDEPGLDSRSLRAKARRIKREYDIQVLIIDYLQLMSGKSGNNENRQQEISEISRSLKLLARELNITVIALSQLSRAVEQREDKRPRLSDLRESGAIEQDADLVMFLYRDSYYKRRGEGDEKLVLNEVHESELIIGKQRNGPVGTVKFMFNPRLASFFEIDRKHE
ncbi:replicative DNA helicase [Geotoga petraea]|jgi:replicative DNA helicase|uniref:Replicative DNA helicase n=1 Tax=Geotoga petraea TaxID=28234 RepID=A0A1G6IR33_9BACT|nr:replicative DNA helicase [Geotoga petraea]MDK2945708.1 replicative helicase [Geotoga sp.]TGG89276.1 replicative DNA helicase [Geotoga petraea]SDC08883.1 replicative DNA helicase [Geotoga petraea]